MFQLKAQIILLTLAATMALSTAHAQADENHDKWIPIQSIDQLAAGEGATGQSRRRGTPILEELRVQSAEPQEGLLLPAVQAQREAARRKGNAETTWKVEKGEK